MYINPIHAGPVAFAHAPLRTTRNQPEAFGRVEPIGAAPSSVVSVPYSIWRGGGGSWMTRRAPVADPVQLTMWGECGGPPHASALQWVSSAGAPSPEAKLDQSPMIGML
jgi:hypothetical protein